MAEPELKPDENMELPVPVMPTQVVSVFPQDPAKALQQAKEVVGLVSGMCVGPKFIANIQGKQYPKVEWWTTVGASLGLFAYLIWARREEREDGGYLYRARIEIRKDGQPIAAAESICSTEEKQWKGRDEYAVESMSITRATGKGFRTFLSFLAALAGLEVTPAEEIPKDGFNNSYTRKTTTQKKTTKKGATQPKKQPEQKKTAQPEEENKTLLDEWAEEDNGKISIDKMLERLNAWLFAEAHSDLSAVGPIIAGITKNKYSTLGKMSKEHLRLFWARCAEKVIKFEKATGGTQETMEA